MIDYLLKLYYFATSSCIYCGGFVEEYSWKKAFCIDCDKRN